MTKATTRIKATLSVTIALTGCGAVNALAAPNSVYLEACEAELRQQYGHELDVMLVSKRRIPAGMQVKLAARKDRDNTEFVNCWIPNNDSPDGGYARGLNTEAATIQPVRTVD